jgi:hypothetical protein
MIEQHRGRVTVRDTIKLTGAVSQKSALHTPLISTLRAAYHINRGLQFWEVRAICKETIYY